MTVGEGVPYASMLVAAKVENTHAGFISTGVGNVH